MHILIINLYSAHNLGDDAIMHETLRGLSGRYPNATITAAGNDPGSWTKYTSIDVVGSFTSWVIDRRHHSWRWKKVHVVGYTCLLACAVLIYRIFGQRMLFGHQDQRKLLQAYYDADLVLSCGGGNFYAHRCLSIAFLWSLVTLAFAIALGKTTILLPQSIGPIEGRLQKQLALAVFEHTEHILLREPLSLTLLHELAISRPLTVFPDLAFGLRSSINVTVRRPTAAASPIRIGVTMMDRAAQQHGFAAQQQYEDAVVSTLIQIATTHRVHICLFVQCYGPTPDQDDRLLTRRIYTRLCQHTLHISLLDHFDDAVTLQAMYGQMDCVIGTRLHTGILALTNGVPVILIAYQPKATGMMQLFGLQRYCCQIETITDEHLMTLLEDVLAHRDDLQEMIAQRSHELRAMVSRWPSYLPQPHE